MIDGEDENVDADLEATEDMSEDQGGFDHRQKRWKMKKLSGEVAKKAEKASKEAADKAEKAAEEAAAKAKKAAQEVAAKVAKKAGAAMIDGEDENVDAYLEAIEDMSEDQGGFDHRQKRWKMKKLSGEVAKKAEKA